jgi:hypothetical protein
MVRVPALAKDCAAAQERGPRDMIQTERLVRRPRRVRHYGKRHGIVLQIHRNEARLRETDDEHFAAQRADFLIMVPHLPEVRPTGDSAEMAEEDQDKDRRRERGQGDGRAVGSKKGQVVSVVAQPQSHGCPSEALVLGPSSHEGCQQES